MDQLTKARIESKPIELADAALAAIKRRQPDAGDSRETAEWQREVNKAAQLREIVGRFVHGMAADEVLAWIDCIIAAQSVWAMPSQTELMQLRHAVEKLTQDAERYRWLERGGLWELPYDDHGAGPEYDLSRAAVDAAMRPNA